MPDDLYDRDILSWSEHQADLLRRLARGERVNDVDWAHVVEEIEDVGLSELHAVQSHLYQLLVHLLKAHVAPDNQAMHHWRGEIVAFQKNAARGFTSSMRKRIDLAELYGDAIEQMEASGYPGTSSPPWPATCPFTLDQLLRDKWDALGQHLKAAAPSPQPGPAT